MTRRANEMIAESLVYAGRTDPVPFFCECVDPRCDELVWLSPSAYRDACGVQGWQAVADVHSAHVPAESGEARA